MKSEREMKNTNIFHYDKDSHAIVASSNKGNWIGLAGGIWKRTKYWFPLHKPNIDTLFREYRHGKTTEGVYNVWKLSLMEAIEKFMKENISMMGNMNFLHALTLDKVDKFPVVYKTPNGQPPPFLNQKVSQYWQKSVKNHAMLWEMGPLTGDTLLITDKGIINLKEYNDEYVANPEGLHQSGGLIKKRAKELIEVITYHGSKLTGTPEHEILTINGTKTFSELFIGEKLLMGHPNVFPLESLVSDNYARALGMMVAEGNCNQPQIEFLYGRNEDLIENIRIELKPQG